LFTRENPPQARVELMTAGAPVHGRDFRSRASAVLEQWVFSP
jgi:hypothetical protein